MLIWAKLTDNMIHAAKFTETDCGDKNVKLLSFVLTLCIKCFCYHVPLIMFNRLSDCSEKDFLFYVAVDGQIVAKMFFFLDAKYICGNYTLDVDRVFA